ncbi:MAG: hypothetical protein H6581_13690 [Bacteroidia bacterium]|nr:hypothetical protein [Bacteroidia bacterium]
MILDREILVSYCTADDRIEDKKTIGWVGNWNFFFRKRMHLLFGKDPKICLNPDCSDFSQVDENTGIHIFLLSHNFFSTRECVRLLNQVITQKASSEGANHTYFVNLDDSALTGAQIPILGSKFYTSNPITGVGETIHPEGDTHLQYFLGLEDLCFDIFSMEMGNEPLRDEESRRVYLAPTAPELREYRTRLKWELERFGFQTLPFDNWHPLAENVVAESKKMLEKTCLSVHLIGQHFDLRKNSEHPYSPEFQNKLAAEQCLNRDFPRFIWIHPAVDISSQSENYNLLKLRDDPQAIRGAEILQIPLEEFKRIIRHQLTQPGLQTAQSQESAKSQQPEKIVYLIHQFYNPETLSNLTTRLTADGLRVLQLEKGIPGGEARRKHNEYLRQCDGVLVLYEEENSPWLDIQLSDISKANWQGREKDFFATGILLQNGAQKSEKSAWNPGLQVFRKEAGIKKFVEEIKNGRDQAQ